jgi:hypothetical protein
MLTIAFYQVQHYHTGDPNAEDQGRHRVQRQMEHWGTYRHPGKLYHDLVSRPPFTFPNWEYSSEASPNTLSAVCKISCRPNLYALSSLSLPSLLDAPILCKQCTHTDQLKASYYRNCHTKTTNSRIQMAPCPPITSWQPIITIYTL